MLAILRFWKVWLPICTSVLLLRIIDDLRTEIRLQYSTIITERRVLEELCMHCLCVQFLCPRTQNSSIIYSGFIIFLSLFRNPGSSFMWPPLEFFFKKWIFEVESRHGSFHNSGYDEPCPGAHEEVGSPLSLHQNSQVEEISTLSENVKVWSPPLSSPVNLWLSSYCFHRPLHCIFLCFKWALHRHPPLEPVFSHFGCST